MFLKVTLMFNPWAPTSGPVWLIRVLAIWPVLSAMSCHELETRSTAEQELPTRASVPASIMAMESREMMAWVNVSTG